jgi:hypothetical protein
MNKYRIVKKINGLGTIKFYVEQRVAFFFWCELAEYYYEFPTGERVRFDAREGAWQWVEDRMRSEASNTWVRAK